MRSIVTSVLVWASFSAACGTAAVEGPGARSGRLAREEGLQREGPAQPTSRWALGRYELISFNGNGLPVELSDGRILSGGELVMQAEGGEEGPVSFSLRFEYPRSRWLQSFRGFTGTVWAETEPVEGNRNILHFEAKSREILDGWVFRGFDEFPLEWGSPYFAIGTLLGDQLQIGDGVRSLIFKKRLKSPGQYEVLCP
jgi:hypothetical protein